MLEAVVENNDDGRAATAQTEQLGARSSDKSLRQGIADGQSRAATVLSAPHVLDARKRRHEERLQWLHQTRRPVNQYVRVCAERCPLTTRHTAKRRPLESR